MKKYSCWKCDNTIMPFLEEHEWEKISPYISGAIQNIKVYREKHDCDLITARLNCESKATKKFEEITGVSNISFDVIYHHRLKDWGPECNSCNELLRTSKSSYCTNCGALRERST